MRRPYAPRLAASAEGGFEQTFTANVVHVDEDLVAFGDVLADPARGLPFGTPVHSLLVHYAGGRPGEVERNDQHNAVGIDAVERIELSPDRLRIVFRADRGPFAGRVSLSEEIEVFDDVEPGRFADVRLTALSVEFSADSQLLARLREKLAWEAR